MSLPLLAAGFLDQWGGQAPEWAGHWLTPIWILGLGALGGLLLCGLVWLFFAALSRLPVVGTLNDQPEAGRLAVGLLTGLFFLLAIPLCWQWATAAAAEGGGAGRIVGLISLLIPAGAVAWLAAVAAVALSARRTIDETGAAIREGVLWPLLWITVGLAAFGVIGIVVVQRPSELVDSLLRLPRLAWQGKTVTTYNLVGSENDFDEPPEQELEVDFRRREALQIIYRSTEPLRVSPRPFAERPRAEDMVNVPADEDFTWNRPRDGSSPFPEPQVTRLYVKNRGSGPAQLTLTVVSVPAFPEMAAVPVVAGGVLAVFLLYLVQRGAFPKLAAIALATTKSEIAQPLYLIFVALGLFLLISFVWIPYNTFGEDIKMLKDSGLSLILILCVIQGVWAASTSVADEIEGRTALTLLSKPVRRVDFVLGKFFGIGWSTLLLAVGLGLVLLLCVAYKPIFDEREGAEYRQLIGDQLVTTVNWQLCYFEMARTVPGLVLALMEALVMTALSVAISTRLPTLANLIICLAVYALGHLTPLMVQSQVIAEQLPPVVFSGRLIATVIPVLDHLNIQAAIATGAEVPLEYLGWALAYSTLYSAVAMLLALTLFEDRDLA